MKQRLTQYVARNSGDSGLGDQGQTAIRWQTHNLDPALCVLKLFIVSTVLMLTKHSKEIKKKKKPLREKYSKSL